MTQHLHEKVHPLIVVMIHRQIGGDPSILFIKQKEGDDWSVPQDHMRPREQPYHAGVRIINNTLDLNLKNVRLRCYFCNTIYGQSDGEHTLACYYTLRLKDDEISLLDRMLSQTIDKMRFVDFKWISVNETELPDVCDKRMAYCWETMRKAIATNYGIRVSR